MKRHAISAVFLKDLRQFWPLAALCVTAILAHTLGVPVLANGVHNLALFVSGIFIISLVQEDAPASLRHEWLTRPLGGRDVLLAKFLLAGIVIFLPAFMGSIIFSLRQGVPASDALVRAMAGMQMNLIAAFAIALAAAVTVNLNQAAGVVAAFVLFEMLVQPQAGHISMSPIAGFGWSAWDVLVFVTLVGGGVVLWLQYSRRSTMIARGALGATAGVLTIAMALVSMH